MAHGTWWGVWDNDDDDDAEELIDDDKTETKMMHLQKPKQKI